MVAQIGPLVQAGAPRSLFIAHIAGGALGGLSVGVAAGFAGTLVHSAAPIAKEPATFALALLLLVAAAGDASVVRLPRIGNGRQTPGEWRCSFGDTGAGFTWGFDLGLGFSTRVTTYGLVALPAYALLFGDFVGTAVAFVCFGTSRAAFTVILACRYGGAAIDISHKLGNKQTGLQRVAAGSSLLAAVGIVTLGS